MKNKALKEGDYVKIVNPVFVNRFGYPLNTKIIKNEFTPEQRKQVETFFCDFVGLGQHNFITEFGPVVFTPAKNPAGLAQVFHGLAFGILKSKGHGGSKRQLYTQEFPDLKDGVALIYKRKVVKTGTRVPSSGGYDYWGEYDYELGYLEGEKTHVLYEIGRVWVGHEEYRLTNDNYNILCENVTKGASITAMPSIPVYIEKCNVIKEKMY